VKVEGFDWNESNLSKNKEARGIDFKTIESVFQTGPWIAPDISVPRMKIDLSLSAEKAEVVI
jgi:hypothetical protein